MEGDEVKEVSLSHVKIVGQVKKSEFYSKRKENPLKRFKQSS